MNYKLSLICLLVFSSGLNAMFRLPGAGAEDSGCGASSQNTVAGAVYWAESEEQKTVYFFNSRGDVVSNKARSSAHPLRLEPRKREELNDRLDPNADPAQPVKAKILQDIKRGRILAFYDPNEIHLGFCHYAGQLDIKNREVGLTEDKIQELLAGGVFSFRLDPMSVKKVTQYGPALFSLRALLGWKDKRGTMRYRFDGSKIRS